MIVKVFKTAQTLGAHSAQEASAAIVEAIARKGEACIIVATGASQFEFLKCLVADTRIDWSRVTAFHLDEYVGLAPTHRASFRGYLRERFVGRLPMPIGAFHEIDAEGDPQTECDRLGALIAGRTIDVCCLGIGENGHIAFNDPPADFETEVPYQVVQLDSACRRQQVGEGWFDSLESVPTQAISMSVRQILKSRLLVCSVPGRQKAEAVRATLEGEVSNLVPASIMRNHPDFRLNLDVDSASLFSEPHETTAL